MAMANIKTHLTSEPFKNLPEGSVFRFIGTDKPYCKLQVGSRCFLLDFEEKKLFKYAENSELFTERVDSPGSVMNVLF